MRSSSADMNLPLCTARLGSGLLLLCLAGISQYTLATTIRSMDIDAVAQQAELIFEGEVLQHDTQVNSTSGIVSTYVTFEVRDVVKGDYNGTQLELRFTGGSHNGQAVHVSGLRIPEIGEQGIYFVESVARDLINPLLGWSQGHFVITDQDGERRVTTVDERPVTDVTPVADIPPSIKKPLGLIEGIGEAAAGVMTDSSSLRVERAMTVNDFKARILELIED